MPSRSAERVAGWLLPPAARENVLGDLCERYRGPRAYLLDFLRALPMVVASRIRRTARPELLLLEGMILYLSFLTAARINDPGLIAREWGMFRLAIPPAAALFLSLFAAAYSAAPLHSPVAAVRRAALGIAIAVMLTRFLRVGLSGWILFSGASMSLLLVSAVRLFFVPLPERAIDRATSPRESRAPLAVLFVKRAALVVIAVLVLSACVDGGFLKPRLAIPLALISIAFVAVKRAQP